MPRRLLQLSWYRRHEYRIFGALILYGVLFLFYAQHQQANEIRAQSQRADQRFARIAEDSHARSLAATASAYASCRRQQEVAAIQREFYQLILPTLDRSDPVLRHHLRVFRHNLKARHILDIPVCERPPKTTR